MAKAQEAAGKAWLMEATVQKRYRRHHPDPKPQPVEQRSHSGLLIM